MSLTVAEHEIAKTSAGAFASSLDGLLLRTHLEAPTGGERRAWTQTERDSCQSAMRDIVAHTARVVDR